MTRRASQEAHRLARARKDREAYDARKARKVRAAEEAAMRAAEQKRREEEAARLRAEERRLAEEERKARAEAEWLERRERLRAEAARRAAEGPPRDVLCADSAEGGGCYHLRPDDPGREACRASCRMLRSREGRPVVVGSRGVGSSWLAIALALATERVR